MFLLAQVSLFAPFVFLTVLFKEVVCHTDQPLLPHELVVNHADFNLFVPVIGTTHQLCALESHLVGDIGYACR